MNGYNHEAFGEKLHELRTAAGLSQKALSETTKRIAKEQDQPDMVVSQGYIGKLELGMGKAISLDKLYALATALNVSMDFLVSDSLNGITENNLDIEQQRLYRVLSVFSDEKLNNFIKSMDSLYKYKTGRYINNINKE